MNYLIYCPDGGQAKSDWGNNLGIWQLVMNGCIHIWSRVGLADGSPVRILEIKSLASSEIGTWSGNEYWFILILLYVALTSVVSKGGLPMINV